MPFLKILPFSPPPKKKNREIRCHSPKKKKDPTHSQNTQRSTICVTFFPSSNIFHHGKIPVPRFYRIKNRPPWGSMPVPSSNPIGWDVWNLASILYVFQMVDPSSPDDWWIMWVGSKRLGSNLCIDWMDFLFWNFGDVVWEQKQKSATGKSWLYIEFILYIQQNQRARMR